MKVGLRPRTHKRRTTRSYDVEVSYGQRLEVDAVAKPLTGLIRLHEKGEIDLKISHRQIVGQHHPKFLVFKAAKEGATRTIGIDLLDHADNFDHNLLEHCDAYFKRSYRPEACSILPNRLGKKIRAFGLNNSIVTASARRRLMLHRVAVRPGRPHQTISDLRHWLERPDLADLERSPMAPVEPLVLFQTRLWDPNPLRPEVDALTQARMALVRALRREFGSRFLGGVVPSPYALRAYPDLITSLPFSMRVWPAIVQRALVAVYSEGLWGSTAFKLAEYLTSSKCIVADVIHDTLSRHLVQKINYLNYTSEDDCVAQCALLLDSPDEAQAMRAQNWNYYRQAVEPGAQILRCLNEAFETTNPIS